MFVQNKIFYFLYLFEFKIKFNFCNQNKINNKRNKYKLTTSKVKLNSKKILHFKNAFPKF